MRILLLRLTFFALMLLLAFVMGTIVRTIVQAIPDDVWGLMLLAMVAVLALVWVGDELRIFRQRAVSSDQDDTSDRGSQA